MQSWLQSTARVLLWWGHCRDLLPPLPALVEWASSEGRLTSLPRGQGGSGGVRVSRWCLASALSHCPVQIRCPSLLPFPARPSSPPPCFTHSLSLSTCFAIRTSKAQEMQAQSWEGIREGAELTDSNLYWPHSVMSVWQVVRAPSPTSWSTTAVFHLFLYCTHFPMASACTPSFSSPAQASLVHCFLDSPVDRILQFNVSE